MKGLREELDDLMDKYVGTLITEQFEVDLQRDLMGIFHEYLDGLSWSVSIVWDARDPTVSRIHLRLDGSAVESCTLAELPEYLTHRVGAVRELASQRLEELNRL